MAGFDSAGSAGALDRNRRDPHEFQQHQREDRTPQQPSTGARFLETAAALAAGRAHWRAVCVSAHRAVHGVSLSAGARFCHQCRRESWAGTSTLRRAVRTAHALAFPCGFLNGIEQVVHSPQPIHHLVYRDDRIRRTIPAINALTPIPPVSTARNGSWTRTRLQPAIVNQQPSRISIHGMRRGIPCAGIRLRRGRSVSSRASDSQAGHFARSSAN